MPHRATHWLATFLLPFGLATGATAQELTDAVCSQFEIGVFLEEARAVRAPGDTPGCSFTFKESVHIVFEARQVGGAWKLSRSWVEGLPVPDGEDPVDWAERVRLRMFGEQSILADLPHSTSWTRFPVGAKTRLVTVGKDEETVRYSDRSVPVIVRVRDLADAYESAPGPFHLYADKGTPAALILETLRVLEEAGLETLSLRTAPPEETIEPGSYLQHLGGVEIRLHGDRIRELLERHQGRSLRYQDLLPELQP